MFALRYTLYDCISWSLCNNISNSVNWQIQSQLRQPFCWRIKEARDNSTGKCLRITEKTISYYGGKGNIQLTLLFHWRTSERWVFPCRVHQELCGLKKWQGSSTSQSKVLCLRGIVPRWQSTFNAEKRVEVEIHHIRRPQPKAKGITSPARDPSSRKNLSGLNSSGLGYFDSLCVIALMFYKFKNHLDESSGLAICLQSQEHLIIWVSRDLL